MICETNVDKTFQLKKQRTTKIINCALIVKWQVKQLNTSVIIYGKGPGSKIYPV